MKKIGVVVLLSIIFWISVNAQTKVISHKSHSGSKANFRTALNADLFDLSKSNFGAAPIRMVRRAQLDSLIYLSDTSAVMVTSEVCWTEDRGRKKDDESLWQSGKDTVKFHPLFTKQHSLDSIKEVLGSQYNFQNPVDSMVFIGYDNEKPAPEPQPKSESLPNQEQPKEKMSKKDKRKKRKAEKRKRKKAKDVFVGNERAEPQAVLASYSESIEGIESQHGYNKGFIFLGLILLSALIGFAFYKK